MANLFYNMLVFGVSLQVIAYIFWAFNVFGAMGLIYPFGSASGALAGITSISSAFALTWWTGLIGGVAIALGIAGLLLRANTYALYAVLLFAIGIFIKDVAPFFLAIPNTLAAIINGVGGNTNPLSSGPNPIDVAVGAIFVFALFFYVAELALQRKVT
jgi:hypothetical protein